MRLHQLSTAVLASLVLGCGAPRVEPPTPPTARISVTVDESTGPAAPELDRLGSADFVGDQLMLTAGDRPSLDAAVARLNAQVESLDTAGGQLFARVTLLGTPEVTTAELAAELTALAPGVQSTLTLSSPRALRLLTAAAKERRLGVVQVGLNFIMQPAGIAEGHTTESGGNDAFAWSYFTHSAPQDFGVGAAWQVLEWTGRLANKVPIAILDSGFTQHPDLPAGAMVVPANSWNLPNANTCALGNACPWHGTDVASALVGLVDNGAGAAGVAGPVVGELTLLRNPDQSIGGLLQFLQNLRVALHRQPRIINISSTFSVPAAVAFTTGPLDLFMSTLRADGVLVFASAGNFGTDVDETDSFGGFEWETEVVAPCELNGVICVGGLAPSSTSRHPNSSWGHKQRGAQFGPQSPGEEDGSVDLYGPFTMNVQLSPDANGQVAAGLRPVSGTSFSAPFVAGVAALVWAADPQLTADQVFAVLMNTATQRAQPLEPYVLEQVNAYAAVKSVVGNLKPTIKILTPVSGGTVQVGLPGAQLSAHAADFEDAADQLTVTWRSDVDGALFTGVQGNWQFTSLGQRVLTARVTDSKGAWAEDQVVFTVGGYPLDFTITQPTNLTPVVGKDVVFSVAFADALTSHTCHWRSSQSGDAMYGLAGLSGCTGVLTQFATLGTRTITVEVEDEYGQSALKSLVLDVIAPPPGPVVTITAPVIGTVAHTGDVVGLSASLSVPQGIASRVWSFISNTVGCPAVPLTTLPPSVVMPGTYSVLWDTSAMTSVPNGCGTGPGRLVLTVTDVASQQGSGEVAFWLLAPVVIR